MRAGVPDESRSDGNLLRRAAGREKATDDQAKNVTKRRHLGLAGLLALLVAFALLVLSFLYALSYWPLSGLVVAAVAAAGIGVFLWSLGATGNRRRAGLRAGGLVAILAGLFLLSGGVLYGLGRETEIPWPFLVFGIILPLVGAALLGSDRRDHDSGRRPTNHHSP